MDVLAFLGVCVAVIVSPGQDTALTIRNTIAGGRRGGALTALGVSIGQAVWTLAASAGVAALIVASEPAFVALKLAGAAYLVLLGVRSLRDALRPRPEEPPDVAAADAAPRRGRGAAPFRAGLLSNLANPKIGGLLHEPAAAVRARAARARSSP